jgi:cytochrome oxidase Cu insertion factor (SCO1/SenC/PrrC family)
MKKEIKMKTSFTILAGVVGVAMLTACEKSPEPPKAEKTEEHCPLCVSDFNNAAAPSTPAAPKVAYQIALPNGTANDAGVQLAGLVDHQGRAVDAAYMNAHFAGKRLVIYFGFPDCDWFCPPSTKAIMQALEGFKNQGIVPVFIASRTDPSTKTAYTPERMNAWLQSFGGDDIGGIALTGPVEILGAIYRQLNVNDPNGNHLPYVALIDGSGTFLGGAQTITAGKEQGRNVLYPAPQILITAMTDKFKLTPQSPVPAPGPG